MNDWLNNLVLHHILAEPGAVALIVTLLHWSDTIILALLKFFPKDKLEAYTDQIDAIVKARIEKDSEIPASPTALEQPPKP